MYAVLEIMCDKNWQLRMQNGEHVEEYEIFMAERQLLVVAKVAEENAAQRCVQRFRIISRFSFRQTKQVENFKDVCARKIVQIVIHVVLKCKSTVSPRSSDPFYIVTYYIKWVTTSWTDSNTIYTSIGNVCH